MNASRAVRRGRYVASLAAAVALLAACGTTVPLVGRNGADLGDGGAQTSAGQGLGGTAAGVATSSAGDLTGVGATTATSVALGVASAAAAAGSGSAAGSGYAGGPAASGPGSPAASATPGLPVTGRGYDAKYVTIGVTTQKDAEAAYAAAGYSGVDIGDTTAQANAVAAYLNAHGGVLGRQVKISFFDVPTLASAENPDQYANSVCTNYTQDNPVVAVVNIVTTMDVPGLRSCLAKADMPLFSVADTAVDDSVLQQLRPNYYTIVAPAWDELAPLLVARLQAQGWFGGWNPQLGQPSTTTAAKIGILYLDNPTGAQIEKIIQAALAKAGYTNVTSFAYEAPGNNITPAVLNFEQHGVTHVISDDIELSAFQTAAISQHYIPRYGITTYNDPYSNLSKVAPAQEQVGDAGIGWAPTYDVADAQDPGPTGPGETTCLNLMKAGGVTYTDRLAEAFALSVCDGIFLVARGANNGGGFSSAAIYNGATAAGGSFSSAFSFASGLRNGREFVPGAARDLSWDTSCGCTKYRSTTNYSF